MSRRTRTIAGVSIAVQPSALWLLVGYPLFALTAYAAHLTAAELGAVRRSQLDPGWFVALFAGGYLALQLIHELGHVLAFRVCCLRWTSIGIAGSRLSVGATGNRTWAAQFLISPVGPLLQAAAGGALLLPQDHWSLAWLLGAVGCLEGMVNLLVPLGRNSDAVKAYRSLWAVMRGRGRAII